MKLAKVIKTGIQIVSMIQICSFISELITYKKRTYQKANMYANKRIISYTRKEEKSEDYVPMIEIPDEIDLQLGENFCK